MRKFKITKLHELEEFEYYESSILAYLKMLEKLDNIHQKNYTLPLAYHTTNLDNPRK